MIQNFLAVASDCIPIRRLTFRSDNACNTVLPLLSNCLDVALVYVVYTGAKQRISCRLVNLVTS